ncbi:MAG: glycosyltransferase family 4 protein [Halioglobus sp.]
MCINIEKKRVVLACGSAFYREGDRVWLPPIEWKSLRQWWDFIPELVLAKPELVADSIPNGWLEVPSGVEVRRLCFSGAGRLKRKRATIRAAEELLAVGDVLMARMPYYETLWCYQVASRKGIPHFVEIHGDWESAVLEEGSDSPFRVLTRRYRAACNRKSQLDMTAKALFVLCIGPRLAEKYVPPAVPSLATTNHLLEKSDYKERFNFSLKSPPRILFVGDIQQRKGLLDLFSALRILKVEGRQFEMTMVGTGPLMEQLVTYSVENGFDKDVTFPGRIAHGQALYDYFRAADIFVLPSVAAEGVPRVTHEAMAFGCPVIATDIGSVSWQLDKSAGIVVPPGEPKELASAISMLLDDIDLRSSLSAQGFQRSLEFSYEDQKKAIASFVTEHLYKVSETLVR